ncbi:MAG: hypothetical protein HWD59_00605 [Coxiellaceae bacterium]|nr:MAG: hypothetical protein HWD59_00605 [Coxiellaceae bacterium]
MRCPCPSAKEKHLQQNQTPDSSGYQSDIEWSLTPEEHSELRKQCQIFMEMMPKFTLSGGLWQLGANIATSLGFNVKQPTYWMMTGLGDGIGVGTGNAITHMIKLCFDQEEQALWRKSQAITSKSLSRVLWFVWDSIPIVR